jgi:REP element-mobilizing transposase RayT
MGVHAAKRLSGFSYVGECEYSITCCTLNRHHWFTTASVVDRVCTQLLQLANEKRFDDHVLREEEDRAAVIRYLLENPIRAGLVTALRDYPYRGSGLCSRDELIETLFDRPERGG